MAWSGMAYTILADSTKALMKSWSGNQRVLRM